MAGIGPPPLVAVAIRASAGYRSEVAFFGVDSPVIRFSCMKCRREYQLSNALSHLPLLCKGCGDRIVVPDPSESLPEPPPAPPPPVTPPPKPAPPAAPPPKPVFERSLPVPPPPLDDDKPEFQIAPLEEDSEVNLFLSPEMRKKLFLPIEGSGPAPLPNRIPPLAPTPVMPPAPPPPVEAEEEITPSKWKPIDAAGVLVMVILGNLFGGAAAGKSPFEILNDAPASPKFPPTDLVIWLGSVAAFVLLYVWMVGRGWSLGARLKRR